MAINDIVKPKFGKFVHIGGKNAWGVSNSNMESNVQQWGGQGFIMRFSYYDLKGNFSCPLILLLSMENGKTSKLICGLNLLYMSPGRLQDIISKCVYNANGKVNPKVDYDYIKSCGGTRYASGMFRKYRVSSIHSVSRIVWPEYMKQILSFMKGKNTKPQRENLARVATLAFIAASNKGWSTIGQMTKVNQAVEKFYANNQNLVVRPK